MGAGGRHQPGDGHDVPVPHFGLVLEVERFQELAGRLQDAGTEFVIEPYVRFAGEPGEQWTMFFLDPSGNALEFKAFTGPHPAVRGLGWPRATTARRHRPT